MSVPVTVVGLMDVHPRAEILDQILHERILLDVCDGAAPAAARARAARSRPASCRCSSPTVIVTCTSAPKCLLQRGLQALLVGLFEKALVRRRGSVSSMRLGVELRELAVLRELRAMPIEAELLDDLRPTTRAVRRIGALRAARLRGAGAARRFARASTAGAAPGAARPARPRARRGGGAGAAARRSRALRAHAPTPARTRACAAASS